MSGGKYVYKRARVSEKYQRDKLVKSINAACLSVRSPEGEAMTTAMAVESRVEKWLASKVEVTSADIRRRAAKELVAFNPDAAYIYRKRA